MYSFLVKEKIITNENIVKLLEEAGKAFIHDA